MIDRGSVLATLYRYELRMLMRDRRTLVVSVLLPILLMPLFFLISLWNERAREERYEERVFSYAVSGPESELVRDLAVAGENEAELARLRRPPADAQDSLLRLLEKESLDPAAELAAQELHFFVVTREAITEVGGPEALAQALELPLVRIVYRANWDESAIAAREMESRLGLGRLVERRELLDERGFGVREDLVAAIESHDVATAEQRGGSLLGRFAPLVLLFFLITGGSVVAADIIAGEKERGTLETVLTTSVRRGELVAAKQLVILTVGVVISLVQIANLAVYVGLEVIEVPESLAVDLSPSTLIVLLWLFLPLAGLVAGVLLLASGRARTYKEFQFYHFPIFMVMLALGAAALLPGVVLRSGVVLVPVANLSVAIREVLTGHFDVPMLVIAWTISTAAAVLGARWTMEALSKERLITGGGLERGEWQGGPALFPRRVLAWFAVMWVAIFLGASIVPLFRNLHGQLLFNLVIVMLGGSLLMIRHYRLDLREALALRPVRPVVILAVVLGAPGLFLTGVALARLSGLLFPVPERMLEEFGRTLMPEAIPVWEMLLILAVLPGICEEIAFRGALLHGLRRRYSPVVLCLVVGLIFGLFHLDLVRVLPTAFLGVTVAAVTLVTGSLYPAMLWHALHNTTAFLIGSAGVAVDELDAGVYVPGAIVAGLALTLLWKNRTPYPDLRRGWPFDAKLFSKKKKRGT